MSHNLENFIRETLEEQTARINIPPSDGVWAKITARLEQEDLQKPFIMRKWYIQAVAAGLLILIFTSAYYVYNPPMVTATSNRILKTVVSFFSNPAPSDIAISMSNTTEPPPDAPPPPPDWPLETGERVVTMNEAVEKVDFKVKVPTYLPKGLTLDIITIFDDYEVKQYFRSEKNRLILSQRHTPGDFASSSVFSNARVKKVKVQGVEATLVKQNNPYMETTEITLMWFADNIIYRAETDLPERELLKAMNSLDNSDGGRLK